MKLFLFSIPFILLGCSLGIYKETPEGDKVSKAKDLIDCEGLIKEYQHCLLKFHIKDCNSVKRALEDKEFKKTYYAESHKLCGIDNILNLCNFNDLKIHNTLHSSIKERNAKIFKTCGIQQPLNTYRAVKSRKEPRLKNDLL